MEQITNFVRISDTIGTAGQPRPEQFADVKAAGYRVVINLAMPDSTNALPNEGELVARQGMHYVHIPVVWESPRQEDVARFFAIMDVYRDEKVFVHCALNWRVSAFVFLYRVLRRGVAPKEAKAAMLKIWAPNPLWQRLINRLLVVPGGEV